MAGCGATCGIQRVREREREAALAAIARAHPGFGSTVGAGSEVSPLDVERIAVLGRELEAILPVRAVPRAGGGQGCDALYLLAGIHAPSWIELVDGVVTPAASTAATRAPATAPRAAARPLEESYLRVAFSPIGRYVALQEVRVFATLLEDGLVEVEETPIVGVEDRRLQTLVRGVQGKLRHHRLVLLDMAFLVEEPPVPSPTAHAAEASGARTERASSAVPSDAEPFGGAESLWAFLFEAAPAGTPRFTLLSPT